MAFKIQHYRHVGRLTNPVTWGSMSAMQTVDATAASTAFPPRLRTSSPISEHDEWPLTTLSVSWASGVPSIIKNIEKLYFLFIVKHQFSVNSGSVSSNHSRPCQCLGPRVSLLRYFLSVTKYNFSFKSCLHVGFQCYIKLSKTTTVTNYFNKFHFTT